MYFGGGPCAFACNFMPMLESGSKIVARWEQLYGGAEEEGMNQPVTPLEYMGFYDVAEGNRRDRRGKKSRKKALLSPEAALL